MPTMPDKNIIGPLLLDHGSRARNQTGIGFKLYTSPQHNALKLFGCPRQYISQQKPATRTDGHHTRVQHIPRASVTQVPSWAMNTTARPSSALVLGTSF